MIEVKIANEDVRTWTASHQGERYHALLCDPPYHLSDPRSPRRASPSANQRANRTVEKGFMGKEWDGGDMAFRPETWSAFIPHLFDGAFGMAFASSRGYHRMAIAIEDAGFVLHPSIFGWVYSSGFPKATRIERQHEEDELLQNEFIGHRYGLQAMKPALEPIIVFQKPYEGKPVERITSHGAGSLNIKAGRVAGVVDSNPLVRDALGFGSSGLSQGTIENGSRKSSGRWPANFFLEHSPECVHAVEPDSITDPGCAEDCPVRRLGAEDARFFFQADWRDDVREAIELAEQVQYCSKPTRAEKDGGLHGMPIGERRTFGEFEGTADHTPKKQVLALNVHPTIKPVSLARWLASLLLPPEGYSPRRLLVPFSGSGSEIAGAIMAGWDYVQGIESDSQYMAIAEARVRYWIRKKDSEHSQYALFRSEQ